MSFKTFFKQKTIRFFIIVFASLLIVSNLVVYGLSTIQYEREHQRQFDGYKEMMSHFLVMEDEEMAVAYTTHYYHTQGIRISLYDENKTLLYTTEEVPQTNQYHEINNGSQVIAYVIYDDDYSIYGQELTIALLVINGFSILMFIITIYLFYWYIKKAYDFLENDLNLLGQVDKEFYFSDLEDVSQRINHLIKSEQQLRENQKEYVKVLAHDIKTPLTVIKAYIEALQLKKLSLDESILDDIHQELDNIEKLMPQFMMNHKEEIIEELNIVPVIENTIKRYLELFDSKNLIIDKELKDEFVHMTRIDLKRLIENLLSNAFHYSQNNQTITICLSHHQLMIKDEGIGMNQDVIDKIKEGPYRSVEAIKHYKQGSGMGMQIVYDIINRYHFNISIDSEINKGTTIKIKF